jgi:hypothetical protein
MPYAVPKTIHYQKRFQMDAAGDSKYHADVLGFQSGGQRDFGDGGVKSVFPHMSRLQQNLVPS